MSLKGSSELFEFHFILFSWKVGIEKHSANLYNFNSKNNKPKFYKSKYFSKEKNSNPLENWAKTFPSSSCGANASTNFKHLMRQKFEAREGIKQKLKINNPYTAKWVEEWRSGKFGNLFLFILVISFHSIMRKHILIN